MRQFILDKEHNAIPEPDVLKWGKWLQDAGDRRIVAQDNIGKTKVSTVFIGLNHRFGDGPPLIFETMIFGGEHDEYQERYSTWAQAEAGHHRAMQMAGLTS